MDDTQLAARLAADLDAAFEALVRAHADRLYSIALRLTNDGRDAEEIAQDTLVRAYRAIASYPAERTRALQLRPWLAAIAANLARNRRRRLDERRPALPIDPPDGRPERAGPGSDDDRPEVAHERRATAERLAGLVAELPERYRVPIVLRYVDDLSFAEMSAALDRPEGTLKAQVHRGLALLRAAHDAAERQELTA